MERPQTVGVSHAAKARRARMWLAVTAIGLSIFLCIGLLVQLKAPHLIASLNEGSFASGLLLELTGTFLIAAPLTALFYSIFALGDDAAEVGQDGASILRLRSGARRLQIAMCVALFLLFASGAIFLQDDTLTLRVACLLGATFAAISAYVLQTARIEYDPYTLKDYRFLRKQRSLHWADLRDVRWIEPLNHYRLDFTKGRKATISCSYAGHAALVGLAQRIIDTNARTSRGGNSQARITSGP